MEQIKMLILSKINNITEIHTVLELEYGKPLILAVKTVDKWYITYTLKNKKALRKSTDSNNFIELFVSEITKENIYNLLNGDLALRDSLLSNNRLVLTQSKQKTSVLLNGLEMYEDLLPTKDLYLTPLLPNIVDIEELKQTCKQI